MINYPQALREDVVEIVHGVELRDPYRWLEDANDERTRSWLAVQQELYEAHMGSIASRGFFREQVKRQFRTGMVGLPTVCGGRQFLVFRGPDDQQMTLRVRDGEDGTWRTLVDPNAIDPSFTTTLDASFPSPDGRLVACLLSKGGDEEAALWVFAASTGETVEGPIHGCRWARVSWRPDSASFYYNRRLPPEQVPQGEAGLHQRVWLHTVGRSEDLEVWGAKRASGEELFPELSPDGRWLVVTAQRPPGTATDIYIADLAGTGSFEPVIEGVDAETQATFGADGRLYLMTTLDAPTWRLCVAEPEKPQVWTELVGPDAVTVLKGYVVLEDVIVVNVSTHDISSLRVHDRRTGEPLRSISAPGEGYIGGPVASRYRGDRVWFIYGDFVTPQAVWSWRVGDEEAWLWMDRPGPKLDLDIRAERVRIPSKDGTLVPAVILRRVDAEPGPRPTVMYGYGGFGYTGLRPNFDHFAAAWVAAGGTYAIVGARGGSEEGEAWHRAGRRESKQNTFDDFIAAARWLVTERFTTPAQLGMTGVSNGATSTAVCINQAPEAFGAAVIIAVGIDMFRSLRVPGASTPEYGDPSVLDEFAWLLRWSPYQNVTEGAAYPAVMVAAFGSDIRTVPSEGHKLAAILQWASGSGRPVILRHEGEAGHATRSVDRAVDLIADTLAFFAEHLGLDVASP